MARRAALTNPPKNGHNEPVFQVVKLPRDTYLALRALREQIFQHGWSSFGLETTDRPTFANVIAAAVKAFEERAQR